MKKNSDEIRETLHDSSIEEIKTLAEVFGWKVKVASSQKGPDLVIENIADDKIVSVMFIESEVGHNESESAEKYFDKVSKRLKPYIDEYKNMDKKLSFSLVIITNAPRKHTKYIREHKNELLEKIGVKLVEGLTLFIVPILLVKEVMPAIFVRSMGAIALIAPSYT